MSKNILLTGAARGIGRATARHLLSLPQQHKLFLLDLDEAELSYCATKHLNAFSTRVSHAMLNLRNPAEIKTAVAKAAEWFGGRIDVLINNAGIARAYFTAGDGTMESEETAEQWTAYLDTNLTAPFLMSQACIPFMKDNNPEPGPARLQEGGGGCIIHVSSFRAHMSDPNCEGYSSTKAGLLGLTQAMAVSGQQWGIRCNLVAPGWVSVRHESREGDEKAGGSGVDDEAERKRMEVWAGHHEEVEHSQHPAGRVGRGEDIAEAIEYMMGAGFMSGQELIVDGGASKKKNPKV